jgi:hypothetical protein
MNRSLYFNYIEEKLITLSVRINKKGKLNILDLHLHSEFFYRDFCNKLYEWSLVNLNETKQNVEAIDLIDEKKKIIVQVSATNSKQKVESALDKEILKKYPGYNFKFISISKDADDLRKDIFKNPHVINFNPLIDIIDFKSILTKILGLQIEKQKHFYKFIKAELGGDTDIVKLDSNLATIVNILSKEKWDIEDDPAKNSFEIERKITFNNLDKAKYIINDYSAHYTKLDKIYTEFDSQGVNKSASVLATIRNEYIKNLHIKSDDDLFFQIIDNIQVKILKSANFVQIPIDELEVCINILIVDAFIRCKIFKKPK